MADRYYRVPINGSIAADVIEGASATPSAFVDIRVTYDAVGNSKFSAIKALEAAAQYLIQKNWPPV